MGIGQWIYWIWGSDQSIVMEEFPVNGTAFEDDALLDQLLELFI